MIAAISMVRNEADIIEAFVRHTLSFADHLFICDHNSTDNTPKILDCLIAEGLPVSVVPLPDIIGYEQAEITTVLMQAAFEMDFSLVIPIDADEFLLPDADSIKLRPLLEELPTNNYYFLPWINYRLLDENTPFKLPKNCLREGEPQKGKKIVIGIDLYQRTNCSISQGNHSLRNPNGEIIPGMLLTGIHMAHFYFRSAEQMCSKNLVGWLSNVCKFTRHTVYACHWADVFYNFSQGRKINIPHCDDCMPTTIPATYVQADLKYNQLACINYMSNLLSTAEDLAETICEQNFLQKRILITVVILFTGNIKEFIHTFKNVCDSKYPYIEFIILSLPQKTHDIEDIYDYLKRQPDSLDITLLLEDTVEALFNALGQHVSGTYIQWLLPGSTIPGSKFIYIGAALTNNPEPMFICHLPKCLKADVSVIYAKTVFVDTGEKFYLWLKSCGIDESYALTMPLFRREITPPLQYLMPCFHDGMFHADVLWNSLFPKQKVLVTI